MKKIEGFITDKKVEDYYIVFNTPGQLGFWYSSDIHSGTNVKTYLKELPPFGDVYNYFMSCRFWGLKFNKQQDICLSLFYDPYFIEFYERLKIDAMNISKNRKRFLMKFLLKYLATLNHHLHIFDVAGEGIEQMKTLYIEKDMYNKSKELLELLKH